MVTAAGVSKAAVEAATEEPEETAAVGWICAAVEMWSLRPEGLRWVTRKMGANANDGHLDKKSAIDGDADVAAICVGKVGICALGGLTHGTEVGEARRVNGCQVCPEGSLRGNFHGKDAFYKKMGWVVHRSRGRRYYQQRGGKNIDRTHVPLQRKQKRGALQVRRTRSTVPFSRFEDSAKGKANNQGRVDSRRVNRGKDKCQPADTFFTAQAPPGSAVVQDRCYFWRLATTASIRVAAASSPARSSTTAAVLRGHLPPRPSTSAQHPLSSFPAQSLTTAIPLHGYPPPRPYSFLRSPTTAAVLRGHLPPRPSTSAQSFPAQSLTTAIPLHGYPPPRPYSFLRSPTTAAVSRGYPSLCPSTSVQPSHWSATAVVAHSYTPPRPFSVPQALILPSVHGHAPLPFLHVVIHHRVQSLITAIPLRGYPPPRSHSFLRSPTTAAVLRGYPPPRPSTSVQQPTPTVNGHCIPLCGHLAPCIMAPDAAPHSSLLSSSTVCPILFPPSNRNCSRSYLPPRSSTRRYPALRPIERSLSPAVAHYRYCVARLPTPMAILCWSPTTAVVSYS
ncbi:hypothetical protein C8R44DRAFT_853404 [Mycena epipterygia]|nr:hypothetical protein C8R44DRAFT_853404 [Mycena epipterygia]